LSNCSIKAYQFGYNQAGRGECGWLGETKNSNASTSISWRSCSACKNILFCGSCFWM